MGISRLFASLDKKTSYSWRSCRFRCPGCALEGSSFVNASSNHGYGANFLFADGSVKLIKGSIDTKTYWSLGTKATGEVIGSTY